MRWIAIGACVLLLLLFSMAAMPDRQLIRQKIILHKLSLIENIDPFHQEEINRRVRRQTTFFPSDDEDISDFDGSGNDEAPIETATEPSVSPTVWAWHRSKINFLDSVEYSSELQDYNTVAFQELADEIMTAVEDHLKTQLVGYLEATPLMFSKVNDDVIVLIDVGMCMSNSLSDVTRALLSLVSGGMIGRFRVSVDGFSIRPIGIDAERRECKPGPSLPLPPIDLPTPSTPTTTISSEHETDPSVLPPKPTPATTPSVVGCRMDQATCKNLQCIDRSYICDGTADCLDGSDEPETCSTTSSQCDPTEFLCIGTGVCAQKLWRCDGDDDCGNGYDESDCPTAPLDARCLATQFECRNAVCIPKSYRCDGEEDCDDRSDEEGCTPPVVLVPPQRYVNASEGSTVTLECEAVGVPDPVISWRVNWGNVPPPPRVTMSYQNGRGVLTIRKVKASDQGAYTCEALNPNGSVLGTPDSIVIVDGKPNVPTEPTPSLPSITTTSAPIDVGCLVFEFECDNGNCIPQSYICDGVNDCADNSDEENCETDTPCPLGEFDASPNVSTICQPCYCFGVTNQCTSSRLEYTKIGIEFTDPDDKNDVELEKSDLIDGGPETTQPITENQIRVNPPARELQLIDLSKRFLAAAHYWSLPAQFLGAKINSYGGTLTYSFSYNNSYHLDSAPTNHPDVILQGNNKTLLYRNKAPHPSPTHKNTIEARLDEEDNWETVEREPVTKEDLMDVLSDVDRVLIRTVYDKSMISTGIGDITLEVARPANSSSEDETVPTGSIAHAVEECLCPEGYEGLSCQNCASGYERVRSGPLLGKCVSEQQGDSPTAHCDPGYTGPGCTECALGYVPHGGRCRLDMGHVCNSAGTAEVGLDRECQCKETTQGRNCEYCRPGYYHLSQRNHNGCLACLCMGVTKNCGSTNWNYTKILPSTNQGKSLEITNANLRPIFPDVVEYEPTDEGLRQPVATAQLSSLPRGVYYWVLPEEFNGNKLSSYGGSLDYVINYFGPPGSRAFGRSADVMIVGDKMRLVHFAKAYPRPDVNTRRSVSLKEGYWRLESGEMANREQLLLILSKIKHILIRASHSHSMEMTKITDIRLDVAVPHQTGGAQALAVEHCICPPGYAGLSCEECADGFYRIEGGSFLGTCQPCNCNGHSSSCDKETGRCMNCLDNTMGDHCEVCNLGYYGNPFSGQVNPCRLCPCTSIARRAGQSDIFTCVMDIEGGPLCDRCPTGYIGDRCDSCSSGYVPDSLDSTLCRKIDTTVCRCDPNGSVDESCDSAGQCRCKPSTTGKKCDQCKPGFFYMSLENDDGCLPCFCMGVSNQCSSSHYKRYEITSDFTDNFGDFALTQRSRRDEVTTGFETLNGGRTLSISRIDLLPRGGGSYYWKLPENYCGDKIVSYGGSLQYKTTFTVYGRGQLNNDPDVIITGNDIILVTNLSQGSSTIQPNIVMDKSVTFRENHWSKPDGQPATREDLLMVLADVDRILIRASYFTTTLRSSITDVVMETASETVMMSEPLFEVEQCECPSGYEGSSCEDCAPGFTRLPGGIYLGLCHLCDCHNHADLCDSETGICFNCRDHTVGDRCSECAPGYYGDASRGTRSDCQLCACPGTGSNSFSETCGLDESNNLACTACREGYSGRRCEVCAPGYEGDPTVSGGRCTLRTQDVLEVNVTPKSVNAREGDRVVLHCNVNSPTRVSVSWRRAGSNPGRLPRDSIVSNGGRTLQFPAMTSSQTGTYECVVRSRYERKTDSALITIQRETPMIKVRVEEPREVRIRAGSQVTFVCTATSKMPAYLVTWTKQGGKLPMSRVTDFDGILHIRRVQLSDSGTYICTGSNMYSIDRETATLVVLRGGEIVMPEVEVSPRNQSVSEGEDAMFHCTASGFPTPIVQWVTDDGRPMPDSVHVVGSMLMIPSASMTDRSVFRCRASNSNGFVEATAALDVVARGDPPHVTVLTPDVDLTVGDNEDLRCTAGGTPSPNFSWSKEGDELPNNVEQMDGVLRLTSATLTNQGVYSCTAGNYFGQDVGRIRVKVKQRIVDGKPICRTEPKEVTAYVGTNSTITCVVGGNPLPEVTWEMEDGSALNDNIKLLDRKMFIHRVLPTNAGRYVCLATNYKGTSKSRMTLRVVEKDLPSVTVSPGRYLRVKAGQDASFTCTAPGQSDVDVTWLRSDKKLFTGDTYLSAGNTILNFHNISINEAGGYMCLAGNVVGYKQVSVNITVLQPPLIAVSPSRYVNRREGESLNLRCDVTGVPNPSVVWLNGTGEDSPRMLTNYRLRTNSFTIRDLRMSHAGQYYCRATNQAGSSQQKVVLEVHRKVALMPPSLTIEPPAVRGTLGSRVQIHCSASGSLKPAITWSKVDGEISEEIEVEDGTLYINNLSNSTIGAYQCRARNVVGEDAKTVDVELIEAPVLRIDQENTIFLTSSESANISCYATAGTEPISISWDQELDLDETSSTSNSVLHIVNFDPDQDTGTYTCTGTNAAGSTSATLRLQKLDIPTVTVAPNETIKLVGESVTFKCMVENFIDSSDVVVTWQRENQSATNNFTVSDGILNIDHITHEDTGKYECIASNKAGSSSAFALLTVQTPPFVEVVMEQSTAALVEGDSLTMSCNSSGFPSPTVSIYKDDIEVDTSRGMYSIQALTLNDSGTYECVAVNNAGESRDTIRVNVFKTPVASVNTSDVKIRSGNKLRIYCNGEGLPEPNITWAKMNGVLPDDVVINDGQLRIEEASIADSWIYICTATNVVGASNASTRVIVEAYIPYFTQTPLSFMSVPIRDNRFYAFFDITISFRPITLNGLLFYSHSINSDFISLSLADGTVEFRFNLGSGTVTIQSQNSVELDKWHTVTASRVHRNGKLQLDDNKVLEGKAPGEFRGLELSSDLYVGGVPRSVNLPMSLQSLGSDSGFYGCISQLTLGSEFLDFGSSRDVSERAGVVRCKTCSSSDDNLPCVNQGKCVETHRNKTGYVCDCRAGYVGENCQFEFSQLCDSASCGGRGACRIDLETDLGFICTCDEHFTGPHCTVPITTTTLPQVVTVPLLTGPFARGRVIVRPIGMKANSPDFRPPLSTKTPRESSVNSSPPDVAVEKQTDALLFNQNSYAMSSSVRASERRRTDISLRIRRRTHADGLILFSGEFFRDSAFISLSIRNDALEYRFNTGTDTAIVRVSASTVGVGSWHTVRMIRKRNRGRLEVDGRTVARARSSGSENLDLETPLFVGGVKFWEVIPGKTNIRDGFDGCLDSLRIDDAAVSINDLFVKKNVEYCSAGSTLDGEEDREISEPSRPRYSTRFTGASFAAFDKSLFNHDQSAEQISIQFRTTEPYGLILYHGEDLVTELKKVSRSRHRRRHGRRRARKMDYITLGVQGSYLVYTFDLGGGMGKATSSFPVSDGALHTATIVRRGSLALMWMDDMPTPVATQSPSSHTMANVPGRLYIGGTPDVIFATAGRYTSGFNGCIKEVRLTSITNSRSTELGSGFLNDTSTSPLDFSRSGTLERINLRNCREIIE